MPHHIFITQESENDSISIFHYDPTFVVIANKEDIASVQLIDESKKPGIYILLGDTKRYVGQASNSIFSRLQQHYINKNWWNKIIFFGREDGHLSKAQLDFLERTLIEQMDEANIDLDNGTQGNQSYIDKLGKFSAIDLLEKVKMVLFDIANIDLFAMKNSDLEHNDQSSTLSNNNFEVTFNDISYKGSSHIEILTKLVSDLIKSPENQKLAPLISFNVPNTVQIIGTQPLITGSGRKLTRPIEATQYHLYINLSKEAMSKKMNKLAQLTQHVVSFEKW